MTEPTDVDVDQTSVEDSEVLKLVEKLQASVENLQKEISGIYKRSDKDRNVLSELTEEFKKQRAVSQNDDDAVTKAEEVIRKRNRDKALDELIAKRQEPSPEQDTDLEVRIVNSLQLPNDDPRVAKLIADHKGDVEGLVAAAAALKLELAKVPDPGPADIPQEGGRAQSTGSYGESDYRAAMQKIMEGTVPGSEERLRKITQLKQEAREKGLDKN